MKTQGDNPPMTFSRWGGLGSHRYPIGFSGDTYMEWSTLQFQPLFTATAANVLFLWSHDIGGHRSHHNAAAYDPELYLRWLQWGAHAPILRTHPQPDPKVERRPWAYSLPYADYMGDAMKRRGRLVPTLHSALERFRSYSRTLIHYTHTLYTDT
jgi:alpha-glucosidase (family GH31 glycosyl hydrolase)